MAGFIRQPYPANVFCGVFRKIRNTYNRIEADCNGCIAGVACNSG
ncbi:hypothetical protein [Dorea formicigenerans]|nr:hypothetical protein [Dorea formicigenerans]